MSWKRIKPIRGSNELVRLSERTEIEPMIKVRFERYRRLISKKGGIERKGETERKEMSTVDDNV